MIALFINMRDKIYYNLFESESCNLIKVSSNLQQLQIMKSQQIEQSNSLSVNQQIKPSQFNFFIQTLPSFLYCFQKNSSSQEEEESQSKNAISLAAFVFTFELRISDIQIQDNFKASLSQNIHTYTSKLLCALVNHHQTDNNTSLVLSENILLNILTIIKAITQLAIDLFYPKENSKELKKHLIKAIQNALASNISVILSGNKNSHFTGTYEGIKKIQDLRCHINKRQKDPLKFVYKDSNDYLISCLRRKFQVSKDSILESKAKSLMRFITSSKQFSPCQNEHFLANIVKEFSQKKAELPCAKQSSIQEFMKMLRHLSSGEEESFYKKYRKYSDICQVYRILSKNITHLLELINEPQLSTKNRQYPYRTTQNELIVPNQAINSKLLQNLTQLKEQLSSKEDNYFLKLKEQYFCFQTENIFVKSRSTSELMKWETERSKKSMKKVLQIAFKFLSKLIDSIIKAGNIQIKPNTFKNINLVTLNLQTYYAKHFVSSAQQIRLIYQRVKVFSQKAEYLSVVMKDIRIQNQNGLVKKVLINFIYDSIVQCLVEINIAQKQQQSLTILKDLTNGHFGVLNQLMYNIIQNNDLQKTERKLQKIQDSCFFLKQYSIQITSLNASELLDLQNIFYDHSQQSVNFESELQAINNSQLFGEPKQSNNLGNQKEKLTQQTICNKNNKLLDKIMHQPQTGTSFVNYIPTKSTVHSDLKGIKNDSNKQCYENNIGLILFYNDPLQIDDNQNDQKWKKYVIGTGTIVGQRTVITTAFILNQLLSTKYFDYGRIRFRLMNQRNLKGRVSEIRLEKSLDIAILLLQDLTVQPKICLTMHDRYLSNNIFSNRNFYCQVIGYQNESDDYDWRLKKSEGYIFIKEILPTRFKYEMSTGERVQGGVIIYFPTGKYQQPYILGIHTDAAEPRQFINYKKQKYFKQQFNYGKKYVKGSFIRGQSNFSIFLAFNQKNGSKYFENEKIAQILTISENSFIFSEPMFNMNKWRFIKNVNDIWASKKEIKIYWSIYREIIQYLKYDLLCKDVDPQNMLCFDARKEKFHALFNVEIVVEKQSKKGEQTQVKEAFLRTINRYRRRIQAISIVEELLNCIQTSQFDNQSQFSRLFHQKIFSITANFDLRNKQKLLHVLTPLKNIQNEFNEVNYCNTIKEIIQLINEKSYLFNQEQEYQEYVFALVPQRNLVRQQSQFFQTFDNNFKQLKEYLRYFEQERENQRSTQILDMTYRVDVPQKESYKKVLVMAKILLKKKIAIKYTYDLFMVCYENGVGSNGKPFVRLIIAPQNEKEWTFTKENICPKIATNTIKNKYKGQMETRRNQITLIERIVNMSPELRQDILQDILCWEEVNNRWINYLNLFEANQSEENEVSLRQLENEIEREYLQRYSHRNYIFYRLICFEQIVALNFLLKNGGLKSKLENGLCNYGTNQLEQ